MKHKFLLKTMLLLFALIAGSSSVWAVEAVYKAALFGSSYNSKGISGYTSSWTATNAGFTVNLSNFNNNNNGWNLVKCGRNGNTSVGTITTNAALDRAITKVDVTIDAITVDKVTAIERHNQIGGHRK